MTKGIPLAFAILSCCATWATAQDFNMKPRLWQSTSIGESKGDHMIAMSHPLRENTLSRSDSAERLL